MLATKNPRGPDVKGVLVTSSGRRPTARVLVSPETATELDEAVVDAIAATRRRVSKTDLADALIRIGLRHMDEVAEVLKEQEEAQE